MNIFLLLQNILSLCCAPLRGCWCGEGWLYDMFYTAQALLYARPAYYNEFPLRGINPQIAGYDFTSSPYFARLLLRHPWRVWMDNGQSLELPDM